MEESQWSDLVLLECTFSDIYEHTDSDDVQASLLQQDQLNE